MQKIPLLILTSMLLLRVADGQQALTTKVVIVVSDPSGAPVPGTKIRVVPAPDPAPVMETDPKGQLELSLNPGGYALFARAQGFQTLVMHFDVQRQTGIETVQAVVQVGRVGGPTVVSAATSKNDLAFFTYPYHAPAAFSLSDIKTMSHIQAKIHNPHTNVDETYSGVRLSDLLSKLGAPLGKELRGEALGNYVLAVGSDGYEVVLSLGEIDPDLHSGEVLVADIMNGQPLDERSGPFKLIVTEDKRPARCVRNLTTIELKSAR
jgi:hypothetical protein